MLLSENRDQLEEPLDWAHGGLDVERPHVLPVLLQRGTKDVDSETHVLHQFVLGQSHVADSDGKEQLLHLELKGRLQVQHLLLHVVTMGHQGRNLSSLVENRQDPEALGCQ